MNEIELGYDPKEAGHLIRFLREGLEILTEGIINVRRPDAQELLAIRKGNIVKNGFYLWQMNLKKISK